MSDPKASAANPPAEGAAHPAHGDDHGHHNPFLAHHFETPEQQIESGKLGMWLFLGTEILLFAGLFCFYSVYRASHPEVFKYAHQFLDWKLGTLNTAILLFSSLTMAWAVRAAQLGQRATLIVMLVLTFLCGCGFLGVKYVEYSTKFEHGHVFGVNYYMHDHSHGEHSDSHGDEHAYHSSDAGHTDDAAHAGDEPSATTVPANAEPTTVIAPKNITGAGLIVDDATKDPAALAREPVHVTDEPANVHLFFGIYFTMTGLHGIHVIIGMIVIFWLIVRSFRGDFGPQYNEPVDIGGLYWHLVDLIWIYLFPLLYLVD